MAYGGVMRYGGAGFSGNPDPFAAAEKMESFRNGEYFQRGQRKRLNMFAVLIALFSPWVLFCSTFALLSFGLHYRQPFVDYALVMVVFLVGVCVPCSLAASALKRKHMERSVYEPSWFVFIAATCMLAFATGAVVGQSNYSNFMQKYYNLQHLARYQDIDANAALGQQLMDAGRIEFKESTQLDLSRSMGFKNHDVYCVSPIVTKDSKTKLDTLDFWAVGKNCCSGVQADFHCPGFSDREARGVIRLMHDEDRPFYRLAVQQAEATYGIPATHPLFFEWVHDPEEATNKFAQQGYTNYFLGICAYFLLQIFLTVVATLLFSKMVHF